MSKVACIVLNFNRRKETLHCMESLRADPVPKSIIVVDNNSYDQKELGIEVSSMKDVHFIPLNKNFGFAEGNNRGIKYALGLDKTSLIFIINNDAWIADNALSKMNDFMNANSDVSILAPKIYFSDHKTIWAAGCRLNYLRLTGTNRGRRVKDNGLYDKTEEVSCASGCAMMIRPSVFDTVGFFDSDFFSYFEDFDFCLRARNKKNKIVYFPEAHVLHEGSLTAGGEFDIFSSFYRYRNRLMVIKKHANILQILFNIGFFQVLILRDFFYYIYSGKFHAYYRLWKGLFDFFSGGKNNNIYPENILIIKLSAIGDVLMATPAIREIRHRYSSAKIFHLIGKWSSEIMSANPNVDELIVIDENIFWKKKIIPIIELLLKLRKKKIDIVFNMHWSKWINFFALIIGAKDIIGFDRDGSAGFLTKKIPYSEGEKGPHQIEQYLAIAGNNVSSKISGVKKVPEIFFREDEAKNYNGKFKEFLTKNRKNIIAVASGGGSNPKSSMPMRRWPFYSELVGKIIENMPYHVVLLGQGTDKEVADKILSENKSERITSFVDRLDLHENAYLLQNSLLLVCNDSALMHIASAVGTKCLSIFGPTAPYDKAPMNKEHVYMYSEVACSPCYKFGSFPECNRQQVCFKSIKPNEVFKILQKMVSGSGIHK
ncbi:MAG: glycosyltransferase [Elusimicrobia bacterium]|nr:glycosyltransferase [Elusimicrobiota bacterium]